VGFHDAGVRRHARQVVVSMGDVPDQVLVMALSFGFAPADYGLVNGGDSGGPALLGDDVFGVASFSNLPRPGSGAYGSSIIPYLAGYESLADPLIGSWVAAYIATAAVYQPSTLALVLLGVLGFIGVGIRARRSTVNARDDGMGRVPHPPGRISFAELLLGAGPRFARDAIGPVLAFYIAWKVAGLPAGVGAATLVAFISFWWQRRHGGAGALPAIGLGVALVQASVGLASGSPSAFFAPGVVANGLYGGVFLGSVAIGRPLAGVFAREMYAFPTAVRESALYRRTFSVVSLVWGGYMLLRCALRLLVLLRSSVDAFVVVSVLTGIPCIVALMSWSLWYPLRAFRRQPELWGADAPHG
jgi:hypothetical protein